MTPPDPLRRAAENVSDRRTLLDDGFWVSRKEMRALDLALGRADIGTAALATPPLDAAWAAAEAALPEGWRLTLGRSDDDYATWSAIAVSPAFFEGEIAGGWISGEGPTPAAALLALAARLREAKP